MKDKRGKGSTGSGLKAYADGIGRNAGDITTYRNAAQVATYINLNSQINELQKSAKHLAAIHKLPQSAWTEKLDQNDLASTAEKLAQDF